MEKKIQLTAGSEYRITSMESRDKPLITKGIFKGYTMMGDIDSLCMELGASHKDAAGKIRVIPSHMIISIDIISAAKEEKKKDESIYVG
ncbi:MAG: hypothetical protein KKB04_03540 [Candidatus Thermoplasmatota archaeon]|nr:hypothetical protein [Candidatus Thermoplasmatota archaeon]